MASLGDFVKDSFTGGGTLFGKSTRSFIQDPLGIFKTPDMPEKTAQELALEKRQQKALDKEIEEQEELLSLFSRKSLGRASLLSGAAKTAAKAAGQTATPSRGAPSMFSGASASQSRTGTTTQRAR